MTLCVCGVPAREGRMFCNMCEGAMASLESPHERDIESLGECSRCGSEDPDDICAAPSGECDECGAFSEGNVCETCARELGGES